MRHVYYGILTRPSTRLVAGERLEAPLVTPWPAGALALAEARDRGCVQDRALGRARSSVRIL